jgi:site-specific DNA-methyltransferase (adenine-specific)
MKLPLREERITDKISLFNGDNMEGMALYPDKYFDLAIVDPPYGININNQSQGKGGGLAKKIEYTKKDWDRSAPDIRYFEELMRVSKHQIIWGANHFISRIPFDSSCWIVWDKENGETDFADCELAWASFPTAVRKIKWKWAGMLQADMKNKEERIHPTQKPVKLYEWILRQYATPEFKILDTHLGSMSIAIACHYYGCELTGFEIDTEYFEAGVKRVQQQIRQVALF